jgi:diketogulonate reductase-like aldo/keto reductase
LDLGARQIFSGHGWLVPRIGQGTWKLAGGSDAVKRAAQAIKLGIDLGMTHIGTAEMYGDRLSEEIVAGAIREVKRSELFI